MKVLILLLLFVSCAPAGNQWEKMICNRWWVPDGDYVKAQFRDQYPGFDDGNGGPVGKLYDDSIGMFPNDAYKQDYYLRKKKAFIFEFDSMMNSMSKIYKEMSFYFNCDSSVIFNFPKEVIRNDSNMTAKWYIDKEAKYMFMKLKNKSKIDTCYLENFSNSGFTLYYPQFQWKFRLIPKN